jgi:hypothetical protein
LGGSIANWSFVAVVGLGLLAVATVLQAIRKSVPDDKDLE